MENLKSLLAELKSREIRTIGDGDDMKYNQTDRNAIRSEILGAFFEDIKEAGFDCYRVDKGVAVEFENDDLGVLAFILAPTMCSLDYDAVEDAEEYQEKLERKALKAAEKAAKKKA